jgi:hypothetical protein
MRSFLSTHEKIFFVEHMVVHSVCAHYCYLFMCTIVHYVVLLLKQTISTFRNSLFDILFFFCLDI